MSDHAELDAAIANLDLSYEAIFVPKNQSRNKEQETPTINWKIVLDTPRARSAINALCVEYSQGIAYVPGYDSFERSKHFVARIEQAAVTGKYYVKPHDHSTWMKPLPKPELRDILYSLVRDADVLESSGFEDWASNLGYDTDSRKAEAIYRHCIEQSLKFKSLIGQENLNKLRTLYEGY